MARFQGALEYLIILGAAVLIAGIVVAYMFRFFSSGTKQNMINVCADFKKKLCIYANQFTIYASTPGEAMAGYLTTILYEYDKGFTNVTCAVDPSDANKAICAGGHITFTYDPSKNTITPDHNIYISTQLRVYYDTNDQPSSSNDYLCVKANSPITC